MHDFSLDVTGQDIIDHQDEIVRLNKDLLSMVGTLDRNEMKFVVATYYLMQDQRIRANNRLKALEKQDKPRQVLSWILKQFWVLENQVKAMISEYSENHEAGRWARSHWGIGPVFSGALLAYIDVERSPYATGVWRIAGMDPTVQWLSKDKAKKVIERAENMYTAEHKLVQLPKAFDYSLLLEYCAGMTNQKYPSLKKTFTRLQKDGKPDEDTLTKTLTMLPWDENFRRTAFLIGESFIKTQNKEGAYYGNLFKTRKAYEINRNLSGGNNERALKLAEERRYKQSTGAYKTLLTGKLPDSLINTQARRYVTKIFLSHMHHHMYEERFGEAPPMPYAIDQLGHKDYIAPPPFGPKG